MGKEEKLTLISRGYQQNSDDDEIQCNPFETFSF